MTLILDVPVRSIPSASDTGVSRVTTSPLPWRGWLQAAVAIVLLAGCVTAIVATVSVACLSLQLIAADVSSDVGGSLDLIWRFVEGR